MTIIALLLSNLDLILKHTYCIYIQLFFWGKIMLRQSDIAAAFRESILRSSKGFQYLHTRDFVTAPRRRGIHFSEVEANAWIAREQTYFVDKTPDHSENRLWMMANMGRVI